LKKKPANPETVRRTAQPPRKAQQPHQKHQQQNNRRPMNFTQRKLLFGPLLGLGGVRLVLWQQQVRCNNPSCSTKKGSSVCIIISWACHVFARVQIA